jgi:hypothetical protein
MSVLRSSLAPLALAFFLAISLGACSQNASGGGDDASGSGGTSSTGGGTGTGGLTGNGGASASGGTTGTGGGSGGATATGGTTGNGGSGPGGLGGHGGNASGGATGGTGSGGLGSGGTGSGGLGSGGSPTGGTTGSGGAGGIKATGGQSGQGGVGATGGAPATGGATGTGGGSGGAGAYNPCPTNGTACTILPFGGSITHGYASSDDAGYRSQLYKLVLAANQKVTFTGSLMNGPTQVSGQPFPRSHEGHDGWTIDPGYSTYGAGGISSLIPSPAFSTIPNIVLLMIGTNDTNFMDTNGMSTRLSSLLDKIVQAAPNALVVVAKLTPLGYTSTALTTYNSQIPGVIQSHVAKGQHIVGVDMSKMPVPADIGSDNVHPNDQGYAYMASIWYAAIKDLLPK